MATAPATVIHLVPAAPRVRASRATGESWDAFIARYGGELSAEEAHGDDGTWKKALLIVTADQEALTHPTTRTKNLWRVRHRVATDLRAWWARHGKAHPTPSFLAHARKLYDVWPEVFAFKSKNLPYQHYSQLAVSALPPAEKVALRSWAETTQPTQTVLRQAIRTRVDAAKGVFRPDFDLKTSNHWMFNGEHRTDGFAGGVNKELYANLIHWFSDPGDTILDPCAGGGVLQDALHYQHFQAVTQAEHSGPRVPLMSDIAPTRPDILQADARVGLPFPDACAALAILDPPYWTMADGKYATLGTTLEEWLGSLRAIIRSTHRCLQPGGRLVVMTDDFLRAQRHEPLGLHVFALLQAAGWVPHMTIYNFNRNFVGMSPGEMARAKKHRLAVNAVKTIQVVHRPDVLR
jgi:SAM-dependent methyltransferase